MIARRRFFAAFAVAATTAAIVGGAGMSAGMAAADAAGALCSSQSSYSGTTITWTGGSSAHPHSWDDAANWDPQTVPDQDQTPATYQTQYVCIGDSSGGNAASVTIAGGEGYHVAGVGVADGASLQVDAGGQLYLGADGGTVEPSSVAHGSTLTVNGTIGGNSPLTVSGKLDWTGAVGASGHRTVAVQTSSECDVDPSLSACQGASPSGPTTTTIASNGTLLVDGKPFGGAELSGQRSIDNSGTLVIKHDGYIALDDGTKLSDEKGSSLDLEAGGAIYPGAALSGLGPGKVVQHGTVDKTSSGTTVIAARITFSSKAHVKVSHGGLWVAGSDATRAKVSRGDEYGFGTCAVQPLHLCKQVEPSSSQPQIATLTTSSEAAAPKSSKVGLQLHSAPGQVQGDKVVGKAIKVTAPKVKTSHATSLTLGYDATIAPSASKAVVYRGSKRVATCAAQPLSAHNNACVISVKAAKSGKDHGDLTVTLKTLAPDARWLVAS